MLNEGGKRGNGEVKLIKYMPLSTTIALLISDSLSFVKLHELKTFQDVKRKFTIFCINQAVYRTQSSMTDELCVVGSDKNIYFYSFNGASQKFEEEPKEKLSLPNHPY